MIYLDNAATSWPKPECVYETMASFLREKGGNPGRGGHSMAVAAQSVVDEARLLLGRLIGAPSTDHVIFTLNCTDALNLGLKGSLKAGDHVITSCLGHNSLVRPLRKLERQDIKVTRLLPGSDEGFVLPEDIESAINEATRLIAMTHASNVTGVVQPVEEYGAIAKDHDLLLLVDAAQTAGTYPINMQHANIDLLAFSGHKGLLGPPGTGALCIGEGVELCTVREGGTGVHSEDEEQPSLLPNRYESGTLNTVGIAGLAAGLKHIFQEGIEQILSHELGLLNRLIEGLSQVPKVTMYNPEDTSGQAPIASITIEGWDPGDVGAVLDQSFDIKVRSGLHCAPLAHKTIGTYPRGTIRLSPGYFNTAEEMDFAIDSIERIARTEPLGR